MTDDLERDLEKIGSTLPVIPESYAELRSLLARLPPPTAPDLLAARQGVTEDQSAAGTFGTAASPLAGTAPGTDAGGGLGGLPQLFYGKVNLLGDPMMRNLSTGVTGAAFVASGGWSVRHILNSGVLPAAHNWAGQADSITDAGSPLNSEVSEFTVNGFNAAGCDLTLLIKDQSGPGPGFTTIDAAPYMIGTVRLALVNFFANTYTNITSVTVTMELIDDATGTVVATSTPFDYKAWDIANANGAEVRLTAAYLNTVSKTLEWQLRVRIVSTGAGGVIDFLYGEPQQVNSSTELPPPFSPIIGAYVPNLVWAHAPATTDAVVVAQRIGDSNFRYRVLADGLTKWGSGAATEDVRILRGIAGQLILDSNVQATGTLLDVRATAGQQAHVRAYVAGDTDPRALLRGDAALIGLVLSSGAATADLRALRNGVGALLIDGNNQANQTNVQVLSTAGQRSSVSVSVSGDTVNRAQLGGDATVAGLELGPGNAARDLRAFRSGAKVLTIDDGAGGAVTLNVKSTIQQNGTGVSVAGHGAADHADITRKLLLPAAEAKLDVATAANLGASPNLLGVVAYADAATQGAFWAFEVPDDWASGVITIQPVWSPGATDGTAHTVRWSMTCKTLAAGVTVTAAGTNVLFTGASAARTIGVLVYDTATSTTLTPAAAGDLFMVELQRIGADAADTYIGVVNLVGIIVSYTANQ